MLLNGFSYLLLRVLICVALFSISEISDAAPSPIPTYRFSQIYKDDTFSGFNLAKPEERTALEKQFEEWSEFHANQMSHERKVAWLELCRTASITASSPFCYFYLRESKKVKGQARISSPKTIVSRKNKAAVLKIWRARNWEALTTLDELEVQPIIKTLRSPKAAYLVGQKLIERSECLPSGLLVGVGLKIEGGFPKEEYHGLVIKLYERAAACGQDIASVIASYRLGLFQIWNGHCDEAEKVLSKIPDSPAAVDYRMRVGYWRYFCADQANDEALKARLRSWVTREYPLSLHSLLVHSSKLESDLQWQNASDPLILLRPVSNLNLAVTTSAIEYLLFKKEKHMAAQLLVSKQSEVLLEKPEFKLYWAILLKRSGINSESFRFMASSFREDPKLISRATLEILYPQSFLEFVPEVQPFLDRYFALSIMRQESAFDPDAKSGAGAFGLMQLQVPTARGFERRVGRKQLMDPKINIRIGVKYINHLFKQQKGVLELALASYNAGPKRIQEWRKRYPVENRLLFVDLLPIRETRDYVSSILRNYFWYMKLYLSDPLTRNIANQSFSLMESMIPKK